MKSKDLSSDDSESISSDELASSGVETKNNPSNSFGLPTKKNSPAVMACWHCFLQKIVSQI